MEDKTISYYIHEEQMNRLEMHNKRLFILTLVIFVALILTNGAWIYHESLYEDVVTTQTVTQESDGDNIALHGIGDIYGESDTNSNKNN